MTLKSLLYRLASVVHTAGTIATVAEVAGQELPGALGKAQRFAAALAEVQDQLHTPGTVLTARPLTISEEGHLIKVEMTFTVLT